MGKILNTTYKDSVENITGFYESLVNNPFYVLNDKKPVFVTYYNINKDYSSLDPGSKLHMDNIGSESPIRYNKIYDFVLYGFSRIELDLENDEFGLEANKIEGESYILPNTIIPTEGDYFEVTHIKDSTYLFMVKDVQKDTLDNGSNVYKISFKLEYIDNTDIHSRVVSNNRMIEKREGTNIVKIVRCEDYDIAKLMDRKAVTLKKYYNDLFYNPKVQTYIYMDLTDIRIYDPFMIEFLMRNDILDNGEDSYIHVCHQIPTVNTFSIDYDKTFFRKFELKDKDNLLNSDRESNITEIHNYGTIFAGRFESYYKTTYKHDLGYKVSCLDEDIIYRIIENNIVNEEMDELKDQLWKNIIIKYFLNEVYTEKEVESVLDFHFDYSKDAFYIIPLLIFCLEKAIENALK